MFISPEQFVALILFLLPLAYSPGPGNMLFAANGARFGFRQTIPATTGYHIATLLVTVVIGLGFVVTLNANPQMFSIIKIVGSFYVLWLAWKLIRAGVLKDSQEAQVANFWDGVVLLIFNPKAYIIIALMYSQFLGKVANSIVLEVIVIASIFTLNNLVAFTLWTVVGDRLATRFRNEDDSRKLNLVFGSALAAVAFWMLFR
jgi:threonine/homoserine/homoserine lactone efflux protein